ncbi:hypothetical protein Poli38472_011722 [Pythium oligandrum]|uniref:Uncharacterized protein n=1 Tax=Pythium oligandrum TaxID=41045 RepID=A0A8K1C7M1_PYTOL|nr:hypothetical protein Poli38472_011722 [Pythium oligandrum]|eukprot:TMW58134.1 hypothetical protein Poli38472_011722 [Pythium oligandrum]
MNAARAWERVQVELQGGFSLVRIENMREYLRETNWPRVLFMYIATLIPTLTVITIIDCPPLAPPEKGANANYVYWIRLQRPSVRFVNAIMAFPIAFVVLWVMWRKTVRDNPSLKPILYRQVLVMMGQVMMIYVFPIYFFIFKLLPSHGQSVFTLMLPLIRIGIKNYIHSTLQEVDDLKPAFIVFNVDVFSAIYVANCLQATQSRLNLAIVMGVDIIQMSISMYDLRRVRKEIRSLINLDEYKGSLLDLGVELSGQSGVRAVGEHRKSSSWAFSKRTVRVLVQQQPSQPLVSTVEAHQALAAAKLNPQDAASLVRRISKALFMAEFFLLIEFTEVMIPVIYCIYMGAMSHLPNRAYYPQLAALTSEEMLQSITTVVLNVALELASFLIMLWLIHREIRLPKPRLLAFALETQQTLIQSSVIVWILYVIQQSLQLAGTDFSMRRQASFARTASTRLIRTWEHFQVELKGQFSLQRIEKMREYVQQTSWPRILLVYLVAPLPAVAVITLIDCAPLSPPEQGSNANYVYWIRLVVAVSVLASGCLQHARCCIPQLPMTHRQLLFVSLGASHGSVPLNYTVSLLTGFPVPFGLVVNASIAYPIAFFLLWWIWRKAVRANSLLKTCLYQQVFVLMGQVLMVFVFPLYFFVFTLLPRYGQSVFTVVLPLIRIAIKNYFHATLKDVDDIKPAFVVFNVDVFSALYMAYCLQASRFGLNLAIVVTVDIIQMSISMYDLRRMVKEIRSLIDLDKYDGSLLDLGVEVSRQPGVQTECEHRKPTLQLFPKMTARVAVQKLPTQPTLSIVAAHQSLAAAKLNSGKATALFNRIAKVLYTTEFFLFIEFAELMIPIIYCIYMVVMSHLPNRAYYPQLAALTNEEMLQSIRMVVLNVALELISFLLMLWLIHHELNLPTPHLLAYALEKQQTVIHSSLIVWILYIIQQSLQHTGTDFSMQFKWLRTTKES